MYIHILCIQYTGDDDYVSGPFNVTVPAGSINVSFNIPIINNNVYEDNERFTVTINPYTLPSRIHQQHNCMLVVIIMDDDRKFDCTSNYRLHTYIHECHNTANISTQLSIFM